MINNILTLLYTPLNPKPDAGFKLIAAGKTGTTY